MESLDDTIKTIRLINTFIESGTKLSEEDAGILRLFKFSEWVNLDIETLRKVYDEATNIASKESHKRKSLPYGVVLEQVWDHKFELLRNYIEEHQCIPKQSDIYKDVKIGSWISRNKRCYNLNKLSDRRTELLESLPGWDWGESYKRIRLSNRRTGE